MAHHELGNARVHRGSLVPSTALHCESGIPIRTELHLFTLQWALDPKNPKNVLGEGVGEAETSEAEATTAPEDARCVRKEVRVVSTHARNGTNARMIASMH
jgi:hypothetical protein